MKGQLKRFAVLFFCLYLGTGPCFAGVTDNQTATLSPVLPGSSLPFQIQLTKANFQLPEGVHSGVFAVYQGKWL